MLHTPGLLIDQPLLLPVFLILLYLLTRAVARHRIVVAKAVGGFAICTLVPAFLLLTIYAFTGNSVWYDRADMVLDVGMFVVVTAVRLVDAVVAAALLLTEEVVIAVLMIIFLLVELVAAVAMPVVGGAAFLPAVAVFQLAAGMASIAAMYLWLQHGTGGGAGAVNAVLGVAGTVFFTTGVFAAFVIRQTPVGVGVLVAAVIVAPFAYANGVAVMLTLFRPNFAPGRVEWMDDADVDRSAGFGDRDRR